MLQIRGTITVSLIGMCDAAEWLKNTFLDHQASEQCYNMHTLWTAPTGHYQIPLQHHSYKCGSKPMHPCIGKQM